MHLSLVCIISSSGLKYTYILCKSHANVIDIEKIAVNNFTIHLLLITIHLFLKIFALLFTIIKWFK